MVFLKHLYKSFLEGRHFKPRPDGVPPNNAPRNMSLPLFLKKHKQVTSKRVSQLPNMHTECRVSHNGLKVNRHLYYDLLIDHNRNVFYV